MGSSQENSSSIEVSVALELPSAGDDSTGERDLRSPLTETDGGLNARSLARLTGCPRFLASARASRRTAASKFCSLGIVTSRPSFLNIRPSFLRGTKRDEKENGAGGYGQP